jgi:hypothetical protein
MTLSNTASRRAGSPGRSEARKYGPREVPPRMSTQGILRCMVRELSISSGDLKASWFCAALDPRAGNTGGRENVYQVELWS